MPIIFLYFFKVAVSLSLVFLFYQLVLRKLTFYNWNRWYLGTYSLLSFIVPLLDVTPVLEQNKWAGHSMVEWVPVIIRAGHLENANAENVFSVWNFILLAVLLGMLVKLTRLFIQFVSFLRMKKKAQFIPGEGMNIYQVDDTIIPFSFGNSIFINRHLHTETELQEIIRHEFVHVKQRHSIDILLAELLCLVNWFNPVAWLLRKTIRQNLEFIADSKVLENGISKKEYQYLLLKVIGNNQYSIATQFNFSSLKKRIAMMNKLRSARVNLLRFLFVLPLLAVILVSFRKQISDTLKRNNDTAVITVQDPRIDTVPRVTKLNDKGYYIDIIGVGGDCTVVVKDKNHKEVTRLLLTEWNEKENYYGNLYGEILPPPSVPPVPPVPPTAPVPPAPVKLPGHIQKINVNNNQATVWLKNGEKENYDLTVPSQKKSFEKKYGELLPPPPPTPVPDNDNGINLRGISDEYEITDKSAVLKLKDGRIEKYDLTDKQQLEAFETKYGKVITIPFTTISDLGTVAAVTTSGKTVIVPVTAQTTFSGQTGNVGVTTINSVTGELTIAPVAVRSTVNTTTALTPLAPIPGREVTVIDDYGYKITGKEDIIITITRNSTRQDLEKFQFQMKEKGVELDFDEIEYDAKGKLVSLNGTMKSGGSQSNFVASDFETLVLAMIKKDGKTYFKVNVKDRKVSV